MTAISSLFYNSHLFLQHLPLFRGITRCAFLLSPRFNFCLLQSLLYRLPWRQYLWYFLWKKEARKEHKKLVSTFSFYEAIEIGLDVLVCLWMVLLLNEEKDFSHFCTNTKKLMNQYVLLGRVWFYNIFGRTKLQCNYNQTLRNKGP